MLGAVLGVIKVESRNTGFRTVFFEKLGKGMKPTRVDLCSSLLFRLLKNLPKKSLGIDCFCFYIFESLLFDAARVIQRIFTFNNEEKVSG